MFRALGGQPPNPRDFLGMAPVSPKDLLYGLRNGRLKHAESNATSSAETQLARDNSVAGVSKDASSTQAATISF